MKKILIGLVGFLKYRRTEAASKNMEKELRSERSCNILFFSLCPLCSL
jgi:hypothetical protein